MTPSGASERQTVDLTKRTYHHISQLREWGIEPHGTDDDWFAFVGAKEAERIEEALRAR